MEENVVLQKTVVKAECKIFSKKKVKLMSKGLIKA